MFGLFIIEASKEPVAVLSGYDSKPYVYATGELAAWAVQQIAAGNVYTQHGWAAFKCQPRRLSSDAWKTRELGRFADGTYIPLPWADLPTLTLTAEHFAHVSTEDGAKIAYTQDAAKGAGDIQTRVKPGKYLQQFYGAVLDAPTIAKMAAEFSRDYGENNELLIADTEEEIERVYVNGPRSCMAYSANHFDSSVHPVTIYAAGDLAVAYMVRGGEITARALVWPSKLQYGRVYGDETRLVDLLESSAYSAGNLYGARMKRIEEGNGFVVPYIDGCQSCEDNGTHLILGHGGINGGSQNGLSGSSMRCCSCECSIDEDDCRHDDDGESYCDSCYGETYSYCQRDDVECLAEDIQEVIVATGRRYPQTEYWGPRAVARDAFTCAGNGNVYADDMCVTLADGTTWSQEYFEDNGSVCEGNGECYAYDDMVTLEDGTSWSQDYFDDHGIEVEGKRYAIGDEPQLAASEDAPEQIIEPVASYVYRWLPSPTFSCDAQLSFDAILRPDGKYRVQPMRDIFWIMRGDVFVDSWATRPYAELACAEMNARGHNYEVAA